MRLCQPDAVEGPLTEVLRAGARQLLAQAVELEVEGRKPRWFRSSPVTERGFCAACGSQLFWRRFGGDRVSVSAGSLDDPSGLVFGGHIFVGAARDGA